MFNKMAIAWDGPEFWLDLTNAALGLTSILLFVWLTVALVRDSIGRKKAGAGT
jgi:hypothetical protein